MEVTDKTRVLFQVLRDGKWHDRERVLSRVANVIPPGPAYRMMERERIRINTLRKGKGVYKRKVAYDPEKVVVLGTRALARKLINDHVRHGNIERSTGSNGKVYVRRLKVPKGINGRPI